MVDGEEQLKQGYSLEVIEVAIICDACFHEIEEGERARMHRRTGELFCMSCGGKKTATAHASWFIKRSTCWRCSPNLLKQVSLYDQTVLSCSNRDLSNPPHTEYKTIRWDRPARSARRILELYAR